MREVVVNGKPRSIESEVNLEEFLRSLELSSEKIAVELNLNVIRKADWSETHLQDQDRIEIVHFVGGG